MFILSSPILLQVTNEVGPEGNSAIFIIVISVVVVIFFLFVLKLLNKRKGLKTGKSIFSFSKIKVELLKDKMYRPNTLTLLIKNSGKKDVDIEAPVLLFRKLWSKRKFKLKGINKYEIYPLYLEAGKTHELRISLSVFHGHDKSLKRFYWAKVYVYNTKGKKYASKYVILRRSLYT